MPVEMERPKFLVDLLAEVDGFDAELFSPNHPVSSKTEGKVIGEVPPWTRKLYSYMRYTHRQLRLLAAEREYETAEACSSDSELSELKAKYDLLNGLMWAILRSELRAWPEPSIGIRSGWAVVTTELEQDDFNKFLREVFGRGE